MLYRIFLTCLTIPYKAKHVEIQLSGEDKRAGHYFYGFGAPICFMLNVTLYLANSCHCGHYLQHLALFPLGCRLLLLYRVEVVVMGRLCLFRGRASLLINSVPCWMG